VAVTDFAIRTRFVTGIVKVITKLAIPTPRTFGCRSKPRCCLPSPNGLSIHFLFVWLMA
jgi:hypothetical protein